VVAAEIKDEGRGMKDEVEREAWRVERRMMNELRLEIED
jgi:hypothetical protein